MNNKIEELLIEYKNISLKLIEDLSNDKIESLDKGLQRKGDIQKEIDNFDFDKNEFIELIKKLEIEAIDNSLYETTIIKRNEAKNELDKINKIKKMQNNYNNASMKVNFFNTKI
ncbi:hypothetical protein SAMN02745163_00236 [Clostridium cavendishii DSM 21758]|uniref:Flagellar protein FliT n=1 Tax=Clostridium cavendishii DSM 21758 TaxID=1121302 RepID=A0A1M6B2B2_9CLOT|nr:hypothetical protein [Clostridium cavendishii]SHI42807.1 hypothetical protein SAMN02745163_00236 [Clostridium cavendishii DSM 21758]